MQAPIQPVRNQHGETLDLTLHEGRRDDILVILCHGVTGNKDRPLLFWLARALADHGYPCVRISFSGNGNSEGRFTDSNITKETEDLTAVIDQLGAGRKIIGIGHSMGGAVCTLTAVRDDRIQALVSLAGMVHTKDFCQREFGDVTPDEGLMWEDDACPLSQQYVDDLHRINHTLDAARELRLPWLLLHGLDDDVVLPDDSRDLLKVLRGPKKLVEIPGADHSFENHYDEVAQETTAWLDQHFGTRSTSP